MNFIDIRLAFAVLLAVSILVSPSAAGLSVSGAAYIDTVSPGQEIEHEMIVSIKENDSLQNMTAEVYGFAMTEGGVNVELSPEEDTGFYTARPFLSVEPKSFTLKPGVPQKVLLTGTVPENVGSGGRYALVTIKTEPEDRGNIAVSSAIQVLVLLTIKDSELVKTGNITDLAASMSENNVSVDLILENSGNVHYKPLITTALKDKNGMVLAEGEINLSESHIVLPTNSRHFKMDLHPESPLASGTYMVEGKVTNENGDVLDSKETEFEI